MPGPSLLVRFIADAAGFKKGVDEATGSSQSLIGDMAKVGAAIGAAFAAKKVVDFAKASIDAAKDLNANLSRTRTIFGESSDEIEKWSEGAAKNLRISQSEALGAANAVGKTLVGAFGMSGKEAAGMSQEVVELAKDMAVFNRIPFDQALDKITAGLNGQTRGMKEMGVVLDATQIKQKAMEMGLADANGQVSAGAKAQATFALMLEQTSLQQGAAERASGSLGASQERLSAEWKDAQATVGQALLPVLTDLTNLFVTRIVPIIQSAAKFFSDWSDVLIPIAGVVLGVVAAIKIWTAVQTILNVVMSANPLALIIIGVGLLVAGIVLLATKTQFFQTIWKGMTDVATKGIDAIKSAALWVFDWIKANWPLLVAILGGPIGVAVAVIIKNFDTIKAGIDSVLGWFRDLPGNIVNVLTGGATAIFNFFSGLNQRIKDALHIDLFAAGRAILESLGRGIASAGQAVIDKAQGIADKVKGLWPFSPAKWGPFAQAPPEKAGAKLIQLIADGMKSQQSMLERVASGVAAAGSPDLTFAINQHAGPAGGPAQSAGRTAPLVVINEAHFEDQADIDMFMKRVGWAAATLGA